jgi:hypothetical protein
MLPRGLSFELVSRFLSYFASRIIMNRSYKKAFAFLAMNGVLALVGCIDQDPVSTSALSPQFDNSVAEDSIGDVPELAVIAREVPSFAGVYFDEQGRLVIALTDLRDAARAEQAIRPLLGQHRTPAGVVTRSSVHILTKHVQYTFLELAKYRSRLRGHIWAISGVTSLDVKEPENRVLVGISSSSAEPALKALFLDLQIPLNAVRIINMPRARETATLDDNMGSNIQGSWRITNSGNGCSLGFSARRVSDGSPVFVTNSHCTQAPHSPDNSQFFQAGNYIGTEIVDPVAQGCWWFNVWQTQCRHADAALASAAIPIQLGVIARTVERLDCEDCHASITVDPANPTLQITGHNGFIIEGEYLDKIGQTSGWTTGKVEDRCGDAMDGGWVKLCSDRVDMSIKDGDSGAPVFSLNGDGTITLRGIAFGYVDLTYNDALMSNLNQIEKDLGGLTVFDPGAPVVSIAGPTEIPAGAVCMWDAMHSRGVPPFTYQWSGIISGNTAVLEGSSQTSGWLQVTVTDFFGRQAHATTYVTVGSPQGEFCP